MKILTEDQLNKRAKKALLDAATLLETQGWCKHQARKDGKFCAFGAIQFVVRHPDVRNRAIKLANDAVPRSSLGIINYNDRRNTHKQQILNVLRRAAR